MIGLVLMIFFIVFSFYKVLRGFFFDFIFILGLVLLEGNRF